MRKLEPGEVIVYDEPRDMCMIIKSRTEEVKMSYDMFFTLRQMIERDVMGRVNEQIATLVVGSGGY